MLVGDATDFSGNGQHVPWVSGHEQISLPGKKWVTYPLDLYPWASLVAQLVKNPPTMRETWDRSLGWEDPLEKGKATHSGILAWKIPWMV